MWRMVLGPTSKWKESKTDDSGTEEQNFLFKTRFRFKFRRFTFENLITRFSNSNSPMAAPIKYGISCSGGTNHNSCAESDLGL